MGILGIVRLYLFWMCAVLVLEFTKFLIIFAIESRSIPIRTESAGLVLRLSVRSRTLSF